MVDRIRWDTVSYLPFYYVFFQFLLLTIFNLQANILTTKDILSNLALHTARPLVTRSTTDLPPLHAVAPLQPAVLCTNEQTHSDERDQRNPPHSLCSSRTECRWINSLPKILLKY